jgi:chromosomal replication initiation ATPase DnaA
MQDEKYIYTTNALGETVAELNPTWRKKIIEEKIKFLLKKSRIPSNYWDLSFDSFPWKKSLTSVANCKEYSEKCMEEKFQGVSLYLYGGNSSGKTTIACSIGKEFIKRNQYVRFVLAGHLNSMLMKYSSYNPPADVTEFMEELKNSDLIIIDDVFDTKKSVLWKTDSKDAIIAGWDSFMRDVISRGIRIIFTSNVMPQHVGTEFGASIYELIDRNFVVLTFEDSVKEAQKVKMQNLFTAN